MRHFSLFSRKSIRYSRRFGAPLTTAAAMLLFAAPLTAQVITASLRGSVVDASGSSVPNAVVKVVNTSTNAAAEVKADENGRFVFPSLEPGGPYTILVTAAGFKVEARTGITLAVSQAADITVPLQVGASTETVEVHADVSQIETSSGAISGLVENRSIVNLPLNQRNPYALVFLLPGATGTVGTAYNSANISINGGRPGSMDILVDGIPASPPLANPIQGFAVFPSVDAVDEFKVLSNGYGAEFGRSGSGIINLILKSGTNHVHGSVYDFLRNSALDANDWFNKLNGKALPSFKRNQFGASITGPVYIPHVYDGRNRTFFLFSYEGLRQGTGTSTSIVVPTAAMRAGDFSAAGNPGIYDPTTTVATVAGGTTNYSRSQFQGNVIPSGRIDPVAANVLKYYPLPNVANAAYGANNYFATGVNVVNIDTYDAKVDQVFNDRNRMFVRYSGRRLQQPATIFFPSTIAIAQNNAGQQPQKSNSVAIDYTRTQSSSFVIEARYGYSRVALNFISLSDGFSPTQLGFPSLIAANADHLQFPGIAPANYYGLGDAGQGTTRHAGYEAHLLGVNNTKILGNHVIKFGAEGRLLRANDTESGNSVGAFAFPKTNTQQNPNNSVGGDGFASFLLGIGSGTMTIDSKDGATQSFYYAAYLQDDWKASSKLTLNLGLRWDVDIPRTERHDRMEVFDPTATSPLASSVYAGAKGGVQFVGVNGFSRRQFDPRYKDWSPRFGFAYQVNQTSAIRGAYGIYFGPSMRSAAATIGNEGFSANTSFDAIPGGVTLSGATLSNPFPAGLALPVGNTQGLLTGVGQSFETPLARDNRVGYTQNYDLDVQHQFPFSTLVDVAYVGSHSLHLNRSGENDFQLNQLPQATLNQYGTQLQANVTNPFYGTVKTGTLAAATIPRSYLVAPYPQYTALQASYVTGGFSNYDSVQVKVVKRASHGLSLLLAFTGQKSFDNYSIISNVGNQAGGIQDIYNPSGDRAVSSNDIAHKLVISGVYELPFGRGKQFGSNWNRLIDTLLGGWQANGIYTMQSGFPLAITTQDTSHAGGNVLRPNFVQGVDPRTTGPVSQRLGTAGHNTGGKYINASAFSQPAAFTFGNATRTISNLRAPGYQNTDFSVFKNFQTTEWLKIQFRAETYNTLNQETFGSPNTTLSSPQFGQITATNANANPRQLQFALKLLY
jgi:hypothetical protein